METKLIFKKMSDVMRDVGSVGKDSTNSSQGYKFRGIDALLNAVHPALVKHGVIIVPSVIDSKVEMREVTRSNGKTGLDKHVQLRVLFSFFAEDGSNITACTEGEGLDSGDKATNKAMSGALKYALIQTLSIPTEDMEDSDRTTPEFEPKAKVAGATPTLPVAPVSAESVSPPPPVDTQSTTAPRRSSFRRPAPVETPVAKPVEAVVVPAPKVDAPKPKLPIDEWS